jgi:hypothetical protein
MMPTGTFALSKAHPVRVLRTAFYLIAFVSLGLFASAGTARSQDAAEQEQLFQRMAQEPDNYDVTFEFVRVATERADYEAAIGALERLLFYNPNLTRVKYELGTLYFRLGSYEMAKRYFKEALAAPDLDAGTRMRIEAYLPDADKQLQPSRFAGFAQTGIRSQSNASYAPSTGILRFGGLDLPLLPTAQKKADINWFGLVGLSHDYDIDTRGDVFETRFTGYGTQQQKFTDLNVGLFDINAGPRFMLDGLNGASIKPYAVGSNTWVGGSSYLSSAGAGLSSQIPFLNKRLTLTPQFEWLQNTYRTGDIVPVSGFNSGNTYTGGLSASYQISQPLHLDTSAYYRRGDSFYNFQSYWQSGVQAALVFEFAPPSSMIPRNWSVAPYVKYVETKFDAANPFIDPTIVRRDNEWTVGGIFNAAITKDFGVSTAVEYSNTLSTLPNYRMNNFSVMVGPTARF